MATAPAATVATEAAADHGDATTAASSLISFPFPLENGEVANLRLPKRLERRAAQRLPAFITALTIDAEPPRQPTAGDQ